MQRERFAAFQSWLTPHPAVTLESHALLQPRPLFVFTAPPLSRSLILPPLCTVRSHPAIEISLLSVLTRSAALTLITASCRTALALHGQAPWCVSVCVNCEVCLFGLACCSCSCHGCHYCRRPYQAAATLSQHSPAESFSAWILSLRLPPVREDSSRHQINATRCYTLNVCVCVGVCETRGCVYHSVPLS